MSRMTTTFALALSAFALAAPAGAQSLRLDAYGVRGGISIDDDFTQLLIGGHADLGGLDPQIRLRPLASIGVGDDALSVLVAGEAHWLIPVDPERTRFEPYVGGGIGLFHIDADDDGESTDVALLVTGGVDVPVKRYWGWFAEGKFVVADGSLFRLEGGVNWRY